MSWNSGSCYGGPDKPERNVGPQRDDVEIGQRRRPAMGSTHFPTALRRPDATKEPPRQPEGD